MVTIDKNKCVGCGKCIDICPGNLFFFGKDLRENS